MSARQGPRVPEEPKDLEGKLAYLLAVLRESKGKAIRGDGERLSLSQISKLVVEFRRAREVQSKRRPLTAAETKALEKGLAAGTLSGVFSGNAKNPGLVYDIARALGGDERVALEAMGWVEKILARPEDESREPSAAVDLGTPLGKVAGAILARLPGEDATTAAAKGKVRLGIEIAVGNAIVTYAGRDGRGSLAGPLLRPGGFLCAQQNAEILAAALTDGGPARKDSVRKDKARHRAQALGEAWSAAFLDRTRDLTQDAEDFLGYVSDQCALLPSIPGLPQSGQRAGAAPGGRTTKSALQQAADAVRAELEDAARAVASGLGDPVRDLPPLVRLHLRDQTGLVATSTRDFTGREGVFKELDI